MARIRLRLKTGQVIVPEFDNVPLTIIRLIVQVRLQLPDGSFMKTREAIFDTGAPLSMLPKGVWSPLKREVDTENAYDEGKPHGSLPRKGSYLWAGETGEVYLSPVTSITAPQSATRVSFFFGLRKCRGIVKYRDMSIVAS